MRKEHNNLINVLQCQFFLKKLFIKKDNDAPQCESKLKTIEKQGVEARSLARSTLRG
jgi:hypothetical protein